VTGELDPRVSDEATGLPPLEELGDDETLVVLARSSGEGLASNPLAGDVPVAVRYLHLRGLANAELLAGTIQWAQVHIAVPVDDALDLAADLARGAPDDDPLEFVLKAQRDAALERVGALERLGACYRAGTRPTEALHRELERTALRLIELGLAE
jgi:hypothetical protein